MATIKRLATLDVAVEELPAAIETFRQNFGLKLADRAVQENTAVLTVGDSEIRLVARKDEAEAGARAMAGLWLEADDLDAVAGRLKDAGFELKELNVEKDRRVLAVDPVGIGSPWLFIFESRG